MRLRWHRESDTREAGYSRSGGTWLQFRSASYYDDRPKEVPNRLLTGWAASRRQHGFLPLDDLVEIAQLTDVQLDAKEMAEGAKECFGLAEWELATSGMRADLRYLAGFTPEQRQEAMSSSGLAFTQMPLAQQQGFLSRAQYWDLRSLEELSGATLRVDYSQPGWFEWRMPVGPYWLSWVVPLELEPHGRRVLVPTVRERTREAALQALRRIDPQIRQAVLKAACRHDPRLTDAPPAEEVQIVPTRLNLTILYIQGFTNERDLKFRSPNADLWAQTHE